MSASPSRFFAPSRWLLFAAVVAAAGCGQPSSPGGMGGFPPPEVTTITVQPAAFPVTFEYVGQTAGSKEAEVRARVTGIVEKRLYQEGAPVRAGQPLFLLDAKPFAAQLALAEAELARARAQKAQADREAARLKPLAEHRAIGQKEADDAASDAEFAAAAVKAAQAKLTEAKLNLAYTRVIAPISGLSTRAQQSEGSLANANTTLLTTISQVDPIWILFNVSDNEQLRLDKAMAEGRLTLPHNNAFEVSVKLSDGSTFPRSGRINFADTRVNPQTGSYEMRAEIANADHALKPGQFVRVALCRFSRFFIDRPIFAASCRPSSCWPASPAMRALPVAQYPEIAPPVVTVRAVLPGRLRRDDRADRRRPARERRSTASRT
jgi:membrane fusion protein (multidrug efflux system)